MRPKFYALFFISLFVSICQINALPATAVVAPVSKVVIDPNPLATISAKDFLKLTPKKLEALTGKKMNLLQKLQLKIVQHKVKKMVRRGEVVTMADVQKKFAEMSSMNLLAFLLGLILGPVGVVIALILKETGDVGPEFLKWSLYGCLLWLAIVLVLILI
ncbi:MAG: hypothetical protein C4308_11735 [Chitinophagaceae bacterium]